MNVLACIWRFPQLNPLGRGLPQQPSLTSPVTNTTITHNVASLPRGLLVLRHSTCNFDHHTCAIAIAAPPCAA